MKDILRNVWYGQASPCARCGASDCESEALQQLIDKNKQILYTTLSAEHRERFEKYVDCVEEYITLITEAAFCEGAQFTGKFLAEVFGGE